MNRITSKIGVVLFMVGVFLTFGFSGCSQSNAGEKSTPAIAVAAAPEKAASPVSVNQADFRTVIAEVAQKNIPALAHIEVTQQQEVNTRFQPFENDPFFHFFFNMPQNMPHKFKRELKGLGSGMIMDAQGYILTNNHVVAGASSIQVLLTDGNEYTAKLVGADPKTDLAVIKINADHPLPHVIFGDSDKLNVGDWVVAIGAPRGLDQTVTQGIISAKHRRGILDPSTYQDYLQTDAAINPGNSGGPLINLNGEVIGVNAAIESESGGFEGIGFAIPSNMAVHIARQLIDHGKVVRGWLGVSIKDMTPVVAKEMKMEVTKGALVAEVIKGSPADEAGLKKDDVITQYQGQAIEDASSLQNAVAQTAIGTKASLTVIREGKTKDLTVRIGDMKDAVKMLAASAEERLGVTVRPVTADEASKYGLQDDSGVAIAALKSGGPMAQAGFEVNDIITAINNIPVNGVQGFADIVKALPAKQNVVLSAVDHRTGQSGYVQLVTR
ncbi:MAG: DegQ family serine endoprotease [Desulfobacteraceae bacterium]|nr:DegQ family serine endoprotease [Desulfobacteraceae bacterium]